MEDKQLLVPPGFLLTWSGPASPRGPRATRGLPARLQASQATLGDVVTGCRQGTAPLCTSSGASAPRHGPQELSDGGRRAKVLCKLHTFQVASYRARAPSPACPVTKGLPFLNFLGLQGSGVQLRSSLGGLTHWETQRHREDLEASGKGSRGQNQVPSPASPQRRPSPKAGGWIGTASHAMTKVPVPRLQARQGAEGTQAPSATGGHSPHRNQAISGFFLLHQARSDVPRVPSVSQRHGLHPEEEVISSRTAPGESYASGQGLANSQGALCRAWASKAELRVRGCPAPPLPPPTSPTPGRSPNTAAPAAHRPRASQSPGPAPATTTSEERKDRYFKSCRTNSNGICAHSKVLGTARKVSA